MPAVNGYQLMVIDAQTPSFFCAMMGNFLGVTAIDRSKQRVYLAIVQPSYAIASEADNAI